MPLDQRGGVTSERGHEFAVGRSRRGRPGAGRDRARLPEPGDVVQQPGFGHVQARRPPPAPRRRPGSRRHGTARRWRRSPTPGSGRSGPARRSPSGSPAARPARPRPPMARLACPLIASASANPARHQRSAARSAISRLTDAPSRNARRRLRELTTLDQHPARSGRGSVACASLSPAARLAWIADRGVRFGLGRSGQPRRGRRRRRSAAPPAAGGCRWPGGDCAGQRRRPRRPPRCGRAAPGRWRRHRLPG